MVWLYILSYLVVGALYAGAKGNKLARADLGDFDTLLGIIHTVFWWYFVAITAGIGFEAWLEKRREKAKEPKRARALKPPRRWRIVKGKKAA